MVSGVPPVFWRVTTSCPVSPGIRVLGVSERLTSQDGSVTAALPAPTKRSAITAVAKRSLKLEVDFIFLFYLWCHDRIYTFQEWKNRRRNKELLRFFETAHFNREGCFSFRKVRAVDEARNAFSALAFA